ncbi:MAG: hypothetical protein CEO19_180 [Parcubacteria group bacterium Gr01-1014_73]|nr:MAG: hypothetical protein CEO19_180 [Parcubacteria group bacterium Gr01-1014_73]
MIFKKLLAVLRSSALRTVAVATIVSFAFVVLVTSAASIISTNIFTDGTLTVSGISSTTGGFLSAASSTVSSSLNVTGYLAASSTAGFTNLGTLYSGFVSLASSTITGTTNLTGYLAASSTSGFTSLSTFYNGFISSASSTLTTLSGTTTATFGVKVGSSGTGINQILFGTCSVDLPNIAATTTGVATCTATGVSSSTRIFVTGYNLPTFIVFTGASSTAVDTIQVAAFNIGSQNSGAGAAVNPDPTTWFWMGIQ